ncbi:MAG: hypothetical protein WAM11_09870 [Cyanobium sp.]
MAATRLSDSQKSELVSGFQAGEGTQVLADRFGCSANTVTRVARTALGVEVYERLKRQRSRGGPEAAPAELLQLTVTIPEPEAAGRLRVIDAAPAASKAAGDLDSGAAEPDGNPAPGDLLDRAADVPDMADETDTADEVDGADAPDRETEAEGDGLSALGPVATDAVATDAVGIDAVGIDAAAINAVAIDANAEVDLVAVAEIDAEVDIEADSEYGDDEDDLIGEDDDDVVNELEDDLNVDDEQASFLPIAVLGFGSDEGGAATELRPLNTAQLPASVYMLVDKTVELQARPLREITELGQLPADEQDRQALVVFTNPRQAKRLCGRTQRVIKLPDTRVIERTAPYLLNQGISRVVIEGALYALPGS